MVAPNKHKLWFCVYVLYIVVCPFVLFLLVIVLCVLLRYTDSDYYFGIFKLFLCKPIISDHIYFIPFFQIYQKQRRCATRTPQKPKREPRHLERASSRDSHITADMNGVHVTRSLVVCVCL